LPSEIVILIRIHKSIRDFSFIGRDPKECVPPVRPKSAGYVIYAGSLAFIIPTIILSSLYAAIAVRQHIE